LQSNKAGTQEAGLVHQDFQPTVYILASRRNGTLYVGVTSNIMARIHTHRSGTFDGFTKDNAVRMLVWLEQHATMKSAILREKRIKKWNRAWKLALIEQNNSGCRDIAEDFGFPPLLLPGSPPSRG
jgi:putative endonuclease